VGVATGHMEAATAHMEAATATTPVKVTTTVHEAEGANFMQKRALQKT
jgi:hypothetical protein